MISEKYLQGLEIELNNLFRQYDSICIAWSLSEGQAKKTNEVKKQNIELKIKELECKIKEIESQKRS